ncbi:MAG: hypothetical protein ACFFDT_00155 [Candidatus Hodarchaeota archaeon]
MAVQIRQGINRKGSRSLRSAAFFAFRNHQIRKEVIRTCLADGQKSRTTEWEVIGVRPTQLTNGVMK